MRVEMHMRAIVVRQVLEPQTVVLSEKSVHDECVPGCVVADTGGMQLRLRVTE
jgi:hypothetical protein